MNLSDGNPLFTYLVREAPEAELQTFRQIKNLCFRHLCPQHPDSGAYCSLTGNFARQQACVACVQRSRALSEVGRAGGRIGGRRRTPKKMAALRDGSGKFLGLKSGGTDNVPVDPDGEGNIG